ncbi:hypothetical protein IOCL2690_000710600 [Leishmania lindenbergi]|uniref:Uncharacterized protein n=1 Tax=Leishmania lindenbergi TaxID=651832 RepID=A0AAW2ZZ56_9TRYP
MTYRIRARPLEFGGARWVVERGAGKSPPLSPTLDVCEARGISYIRPGGLTRHRCRTHDESTPNGTIESSRRRREESPPDVAGCRGLKGLKAKDGMQTGC